MLIGPSVNLVEFEKCIADRRIEVREEQELKINKMHEIEKILRTAPKTVFNDEAGYNLLNPEYAKATEDMDKTRKEYEELRELEEHLKIKANELAEIEPRAKHEGKFFNKEEEILTLSLNDSIKYGIISKVPGADTVNVK